ncbi:MAG: hypothetical protein DDT32_00686 [Syntrophomonadaceae bacterium]|nr:hypothetical protein [Bacillota bacterium]
MLEGPRLFGEEKLVQFDSASFFESLTRNTLDWITVVDNNSHEWLSSNRNSDAVLTDVAFETIVRKWIVRQIGSKCKCVNYDVDFTYNGVMQSFIVNTFNIKWCSTDATLFIFTDITLGSLMLKPIFEL